MKDQTTDYALKVAAGDIVAGPYVRGACKRHLNDLESAGDRGFFFDKKEAQKSIRFFKSVLRLNGGQFEGKPFVLLPWQCFIVGSIFGWKRKIDKMRRFRVAYVETAKGSGKSPLCAGVGIKGLAADGEARAEIYAAATFRDQAMVLFRDAVAFYDQSPDLQNKLIASGAGAQRWNLAYPEKGSFFRVISSEKKGQSGPRPHMALLDEIHEHTDGTIIELLRAGFKFRRQPLSFMITNSGFDKTTVCWEYHDLGAKVACEQLVNDEMFAYICALDDEDLKDDAYLTNESVWIKVNPSLDAGIPGYGYIRGQVTEAGGLPSKVSTVKRLCFCVWTEAENPWIGADAWLSCRDESFDEALLSGRRCWGGLDLSSVKDLTAFVLLFEPIDEDPFWRLVPYFWMPGDGLRRRVEIDKVPYDIWKRDGHLFTFPGPAVNKSAVCKFMLHADTSFDLQGVAFDRHLINDLIEFAEKAGVDLAIGKWVKDAHKWDFGHQSGIKMLPFGQEARSMSPAVAKFETMLVERSMRHTGNPVMTWCAANAVCIENEDSYRKISKRKSTGRVDGIVAAVMAAGVESSAQKNEPEFQMFILGGKN